MLIAIDHGNYAIKTPHTSFISGLIQHTAKPPLADEVIEYDGRYWTLTSKRLPYMRDKTTDENFFVLSLFAIAREVKRKGGYSPTMQLELAVGLPPEHFGMQKDRFAEYFHRSDPVKFTYNDKSFAFTVRRVFVYPQTFAAVAPAITQISQHSRLFLVDIGGYTTDVLLLRSGKPDMQFCRSLETGVLTMNNDVIRRVNSGYGMRIEDDHISAVLSGLETVLPEEVKSIIRSAAREHTNLILSDLREQGVDLRANPVTFIGGGSILLRPYLEQSGQVVKATFIDDPKANAIGYHTLAAAQMQVGGGGDGK